MKAASNGLGIRCFRPKLKKAAERLKDLRTPEDQPIRPTRWPSCVAIWRAVGWSVIRFGRSSMLACSVIEHAPSDGRHAMVRLSARVIGIGFETADMLVQEVLSRNMRDRWAVACYAGLTGSPDGAAENAGRRAGVFRQRSSLARHDPIGMAISHVPEGQCLGEVVSCLY